MPTSIINAIPDSITKNSISLFRSEVTHKHRHRILEAIFQRAKTKLRSRYYRRDRMTIRPTISHNVYLILLIKSNALPVVVNFIEFMILIEITENKED